MRYANITSIPSSYIVAFFSSLGDASPPGEDVMPPGEGSIPQLGNKKMYSEVIKIMHEYGYMM